MVEGILTLWHAYNFNAVLPDGLPHEIAYTLLAVYFDEPAARISERITHLEFCDYDTGSCPFPKNLCMCKDFEMDISEDEQSVFCKS